MVRHLLGGRCLSWKMLQNWPCVVHFPQFHAYSYWVAASISAAQCFMVVLHGESLRVTKGLASRGGMWNFLETWTTEE